MKNDIQLDLTTGWDPKKAESFAPWLGLLSKPPFKHFIRWNTHPKPMPYDLRKWHPSELHSEYSKLQNQIYEQVINENKKSGYAVSGYFSYRTKGTKDTVKELSLWLQGDQKNHDVDVNKFIAMSERLSINAVGVPLSSNIKNFILDINSKTHDRSYKNYYVYDIGYGYNFSNYNAASARETWARQYVLSIDTPDRAKVRSVKIAEFEATGKSYAGFDPIEWGFKLT